MNARGSYVVMAGSDRRHVPSMLHAPGAGQGFNCDLRAARDSARPACVNTTRRYELFLLFAFSLAACAGQAMRPPTDVADASDKVEVTDRKVWRRPSKREEFQLGAYRVTEVKRKGVESSGYSIFGWGTRRMGTTFSYVLTVPNGRIDALCELEQEGSQTKFSGKLGCRCGNDKLMTAVGREAEVGSLTLGGQDYMMQAVRSRISGSDSDDPIGYRVDPKPAGTPLGAVGVTDGVWLRKGLDESARQQLTCLLAGVMLFRPIAHSERRTNN